MVIGEGAYSSVYHVRRINDNDFYALKKVRMMKLSDKEKENALNEVRILASIRHPNIVAYREAFIDEPSSSLWYRITLILISILYVVLLWSMQTQEICFNKFVTIRKTIHSSRRMISGRSSSR